MRRHSRHLLALVALMATLALAGCGGELQTPGEALRLLGRSLPGAYLGEPYEEALRAVGGLRPFEYRIERGALPDGMELVNGTLRGTPTELGTFEFTVAVSDANLSSDFDDYTLTVTERPAPQLQVVAPSTEIREPTRIRLVVSDAHELRAASAVVSWDPRQLRLVADSVEPTSGVAALWNVGEGTLQIDMAALGTAWSGERELAAFSLAPVDGAARVVLGREVVLIDDRDTRHFEIEELRGSADGPASPGPDTDATPGTPDGQGGSEGADEGTEGDESPDEVEGGPGDGPAGPDESSAGSAEDAAGDETEDEVPDGGAEEEVPGGGAEDDGEDR